MSEKRKRYILPEEEIPHYWYNIQADMVNKPMPPLHPGTKQPLKAEDLYPIFAKELCHQELNQTDAWIEIPEEVREMYKYYRSTPLVRAYGLEKALGTPAHIYFKNESVSPIGSHKLNSALAQAYYCKEEGVTNITTEKVVRTAGKPHHIELVSNRNELTADGKDLAYVTVKVVDKDGNLCPADNRQINFSVKGTGKYRAAANGDPTNLEQFHLPKMHAFNGMLTAILQAGETAGEIVFTAKANGVKAGNIRIQTK